MPPTPRGSFLCGRKKYSSHQALYLACQSGSCASQAAFSAAWKASASGASCDRCSASKGVRSPPPPNQLWVVAIKRVFMCTAGTRGLRMWAIRLTPVAKKRRSCSVPRHGLGELRAELAMHGRDMHPHLLEQAPVHHAHDAPRRPRDGARASVRTVRARRDRGRRAPRPPRRLEGAVQLVAQVGEPGARLRLAGVQVGGGGRRQAHGSALAARGRLSQRSAALTGCGAHAPNRP